MKKYLTVLGVGLVLALSSCSKDSSPGYGPGASPADTSPQNEFGLGPAAVDLRSAGFYVILTKAGVTNVPMTAGGYQIIGNIGVSPIAVEAPEGPATSGFALVQDASGEFFTSAIVDGRIYAANSAPPTPSLLTVAVVDMETAYNDAAGRTIPDEVELAEGLLVDLTLSPGLYKWGTDVLITTDLYLDGSAEDVFIFQIAQNVNIAAGKKIILTGGLLAKNVFWQVGGEATLETTSVFEGVILSKTAIVMRTNSSLNGRAYAQTAATLDMTLVTQPAE